MDFAGLDLQLPAIPAKEIIFVLGIEHDWF